MKGYPKVGGGLNINNLQVTRKGNYYRLEGSSGVNVRYKNSLQSLDDL